MNDEIVDTENSKGDVNSQSSPKKKRAVTPEERLAGCKGQQAELSMKMREISRESKTKESRELKQLYALICKGVYEDLEDTKQIDDNEYTRQVRNLNRILSSNITTKGDVAFLQSKGFMVE